jgi:hypothetical protein
MENLKALYNTVLLQNNAGIVSYNAREFGVDNDAIFVWDMYFGMWLGCANPIIFALCGDVAEWEETVDGERSQTSQRWSRALVSWVDIWTGQFNIEFVEGPMACAFQYELEASVCTTP